MAGASSTTDAPSRPPGRSVVWHLSAFALLIALPVLAVLGALLHQTARDQQERLREKVVDVARGIGADLDRDLNAMASLLSALGAAAESDGELGLLAPQSARLAAEQGVGVIARRPDGRIAMRAGALAEAADDLLLDVHRRAAGARAPAVSGLDFDARLNPVYRLVAPVIREDRVTLLMEAVLPSERARGILRQGLPGTVWAASLMDTNGRLVSRTRNPEQSVGALATPEFRRAVTGESGTWLGPSHEGNPLLGGFALSRATGWYVAVGIERDLLGVPVRRQLALGLFTLACAALASGIVAVWFGRRIARPILSLAALSSGDGAQAGAPRSGGLREVNVVAEGLRRANEEIVRRNAGLVDSEAHFRSFVELTPQMPWTADPSGAGLDVDERWSAFTGLTREEIAAGRWVSALHPADQPGFLAAWRAAMQGGEPFDREHRLRAADGRWRWMRTRAFARRGEDGRIARWYGTTEDVEERRRARETLRSSQDRLKLGLEVAGVGIAELDEEAPSVTLDARAAEILGLPACRPLPRTILRERIHPDDRPGLFPKVDALLGPEGEGFLAAEYRVVRDDGSVRWLHGRHQVEYAEVDGVRRARRGLLAVLDVTARREDEQRLARSFAEIAAIYDGAPVGLCVLDAELRFVRVNERLAEINGLPAADHIGRHLREVVPDLAGQAETMARRVLETGRPIVGVEITGETAAQPGVKRIWRESWQPLTDASGRVYGVGIMAEEITRERRDAAALADAAAQMRATADAVPGLMWVADPQGRNSFVNQGFCDYVGRPAEGLLGDGWTDTLHPDDHEANAALWRRVAVAGEPFESLYRFRRHDGAWRWHLARTVPQKDAEGRIARWVGIATDIDDIMKARLALEDSRAELERRVAQAIAERNEIWNVTPDLLGVCDLAGRWRSVNPAWTAVLGFSAAEIVAMRPGQLVHQEDRATLRAALDGLARGEASANVECRCRRKDGGHRRMAWTMVARDGLVYAAARDVTEQQEAQDKLREARDALHQAQKSETVGQLTGGVAHDFNNLLAAILSNLELARKQEALDARTARLIDGAIQGVERGASLTSRLLAFARRQELSARAVDVAALVAGVGELLARSLGPTIPLRTEVPAGLPAVMVDPHQLELALLNLAVNARDAMPEGGEARIAARAVEMGPRNRERLTPGRYVALSVEDNGEGMDKATLERAAEPFFTTKGLGKGTGLGLPMVQGLMAQSRGAMLLDSKPGKGTRVTLLLPVAPAGEEAPAPAPSAPAAATQAGTGSASLNVLVVDDDPLVAMGTAAMLEDLGHQVREAASGGEALSILAGGAPVDLVLTDQAMPGMTGVELAGRLAQLRPDLPVILSTGYADLKPEEKPIDLPRLRKPFRQGELERMLSETLRRAAPAGKASG